MSARARGRGRGSKQQQHSLQLRQKLGAPSSAGKCASPEPGGESAGGGPDGLCCCANGLHIPGALRPPDKRLNGGDVTVMPAPAHPRPEKGAECGERPALEGETERGQLSPGPGERQALRPEPPARAPPPQARTAPGSAPHAESLSPRPRPAWRRRWQSRAGGASQVRTPAFPLRPPLRRLGRAGWRWVRAEARGRRTGGGGQRQLRWVAETFQTGAGWGTGVGGSPALSRTPQSVPPPLRPPLCVSPPSAVTYGPAPSPVPVDAEGRLLWPEGIGERGWVPAHSVPKAGGAPV